MSRKRWPAIAIRYAFLLFGATLLFQCSSASKSSSYGSPADCTAAGGVCVIPAGGNPCAKEGPQNTCNCNPDCTTAGQICCVAFADGGDQ
jgi:hypothetical protein